MHAPWWQITNEVLDQVAPDVGVQLELDEVAVVGHVTLMVRWAVGRCPDAQPPSFNDVVRGPNAARLVAAGARFKGDPDAFVEALCNCTPALLQLTPEGIRVRGLDRYDAMWGKNHPAEWKRLRETGTFSSRDRSETVPEPAPNRAPDADADADRTTTPLTPLQKGGSKRVGRRVSKREAAREARLYPSGRPTVRLCEGCEQRNATGAMGNEPGRWLCQRCVDVVDGHRGRFDEDCQGFFDFVDEWVEQQRRQRSAVQQA